MILNGQEEALNLILLNYANNDSTGSYETIRAIKAILGCDGEATLRDQFAMASMRELIRNPQNWLMSRNADALSDSSYKIADAMMKKRKESQ